MMPVDGIKHGIQSHKLPSVIPRYQGDNWLTLAHGQMATTLVCV